MANVQNVLFKKLTQAQFEALAVKDNGTLYRVTQTDGKEDFYQGINKLNGAADIAKAIDALDYTVSVDNASGDDVYVLTGFEIEDGVLKANSRTQQLIKKVAVSGDAEDLAYDNSTSGLSATDVQTAIDEVASQSAGGVNSKTVYMTETSGGSEDAFSKRYTFYQGSEGSSTSPVATEKIGQIDTAKDMVVEDGKCRKATEQDVSDAGTDPGFEEGDYILVLTIANKASSKIFIPVQGLVDVYTAQKNATQVQLAIDENNVISATIVAGSITSTELADDAVNTAKLENESVSTAKLQDNAVTTVKIKNGAVTEDKLAEDVKTKLNKAVGVEAVTESTTNGSISVTTDGVVADVAVHGLGSAAFTEASAYDPVGSASAAQSNAEDYARGLLVWEVVE